MNNKNIEIRKNLKKNKKIKIILNNIVSVR